MGNAVSMPPPQADQVAEPTPDSEVSRATVVERLFREHNEALIRFLRGRVGSHNEALEVAQEAYVRLLSLDQPGAVSYLRAFLFKTAANLAVDRLRHRRVRQRSEEQPQLFEELNPTGGELDDPAEQLLAREQADQLLRILQELPAKCQQVMNLHRFEGASQRDVSLRLGISERMVRRYVTYAMVYCRLRLDGMAVDEVRKRAPL